MTHRLVSLALSGLAATAFLVPASAATAAPHQSCVRTFAAPAEPNSPPFGVTAGPNGGTYYSDGPTIDVITGDHTTTFTVPDASTSSVGWLTWDGNTKVWFADRGNGRLGTIDAAGHIREWQIPDGANGPAVPHAIVLGPGSAVWFTDQANDRLGRLEPQSGTFTFYPVPSGNPLGMVRGGDGDLYFTERAFDKVGRFDPNTGLFTEWTLPAGAFPNRLTVGPDGTVWFTTLFTTPSAVWHISSRGYLSEHPVDGGSVGITYWHGHLWTAQFEAGAVDQLSLHGAVQRTWTVPDPANAGPLQIAASQGYLWTTGFTAVYRIDPSC